MAFSLPSLAVQCLFRGLPGCIEDSRDFPSAIRASDNCKINLNRVSCQWAGISFCRASNFLPKNLILPTAIQMLYRASDLLSKMHITDKISYTY